MSSSLAIIAALFDARVVSGVQGRLPQLKRASELTVAIPISTTMRIIVSVPVAVPIVAVPIAITITVATVRTRILCVVSILKRQTKIALIQLAISVPRVVVLVGVSVR